MTRYYTGVGSRETPLEICRHMTALAGFLEIHGWTLRSGAAEGADEAFEAGVVRGNKQIYLPWSRFNGSTSSRLRASPEAMTIASLTHPAWLKCGGGARSMHARNVHQVLGDNVLLPVRSEFVICWTPDGAERTEECSKDTGGTAMAIRIAHRYGVPVYNLQRDERSRAFHAWLGAQFA